MKEIIKNLAYLTVQIDGSDVLSKLWKNEPWYVALLVIGVVLGVIGMLRVKQGEISADLGRSVGAIALFLLTIMFGLGFAIRIVNLLLGFPDIPKDGWFGWFAGAAIILSLTIAYIVKNARAVLSKVIGGFDEATMDWASPTAPTGVKWVHRISGVLPIILFACHPAINEWLKFVPASVIAAAGLLAFLATTGWGQKPDDSEV